MTAPSAEKIFPVSWDQFHRDARALAWRLSGMSFTAMVAVTRGGMVPAAIIARELGLRVIETLSVASYGGGEGAAPESEQGGLKILKPIAPDLLANGGAGVLVVDDLVDTGATAKLVRELLPAAHLATVYAKPAGPTAGRHVRHGSLAGHLDQFPLGPAARLRAADRARRRIARAAKRLRLERGLSGRGETGRRKGLKSIQA